MKEKIKKLLLSLLIVVSVLFKVSADSSFLIINEESEINKDIIITIDLNSIDYDNFTFRLLSNNTLETLSSENIDLVNDNEEITFDYCINCSKLSKIVLDYKLPSDTKVGDKITLYAEVINKDNLEEKVSVRKTITIIEKKEENKKEEKKDNKTYNQRQNFSFKSSNRKNTFRISNTSSFKKVTYKGSDNNYLKSLSVSNYKFINRKFSKDGLTYFITVKNNIKSVKINAKSESAKAKVSISGNNNLKVGINKVLITVTSQSGKTRNYRVFVTREEGE